MWLITLVWGWYAVGTHHGRRDEVIRRLYDSVQDIQLSNGEQIGSRDHVAIITIRDGSRYADIVQPLSTRLEEHSNPEISRTRESDILEFSIEADELADGPFYNYARSQTWSYVSDSVVQAFANSRKQHRAENPEASHSSVQASVERDDGINIPLLPQASDTTNSSESDLEAIAPSALDDGSSTPLHRQDLRLNEPYARALRRCGFQGSGGRLPSFRSATKTSDTGSGSRTAVAFVFAFVVQGVTSWSAFMIDYSSPTVGIGCRSFTYMLYFFLSTSSCLLFILASQCYNYRSFLREYHDDRDIELGNLSNSSSQTHTESRDSDRSNVAMFSFLGAVSIVALLLGKMLAILNAFFIVTSCILDFAGVYHNCFCNSSYIGLRGQAYIALLSASDLVDIARPYWYSGAGVAIFTVLFVGICFDLARRG